VHNVIQECNSLHWLVGLQILRCTSNDVEPSFPYSVTWASSLLAVVPRHIVAPYCKLFIRYVTLYSSCRVHSVGAQLRQGTDERTDRCAMKTPTHSFTLSSWQSLSWSSNPLSLPTPQRPPLDPLVKPFNKVLILTAISLWTITIFSSNLCLRLPSNIFNEISHPNSGWIPCYKKPGPHVQTTVTLHQPQSSKSRRTTSMCSICPSLRHRMHYLNKWRHNEEVISVFLTVYMFNLPKLLNRFKLNSASFVENFMLSYCT